MAYEKNQAMVLINGRGAGLDGYGVACNDTLSVLNVEPGKTYRLRIIAGTGISTTTFAIEGHNNLEVIEADGYVSSFLDVHGTHKIQGLYRSTQHTIYSVRSWPAIQCSSPHFGKAHQKGILSPT